MADRIDDVEEILDRHARRLVRELGGLFADMGEALRRAAEPESPASSPGKRAEPTRDDLYREATRLGVPGRSRMTKQELRDAIKRFGR
jgi:hypothetical protein